LLPVYNRRAVHTGKIVLSQPSLRAWLLQLARPLLHSKKTMQCGHPLAGFCKTWPKCR